VDAQEGRFMQGIASVLAAGTGEVEFRLDDSLVAVVGQGDHPRFRRHDFRIAGRPPASALPPDGVGELKAVYPPCRRSKNA
jgi:hypothetical protein